MSVCLSASVYLSLPIDIVIKPIIEVGAVLQFSTQQLINDDKIFDLAMHAVNTFQVYLREDNMNYVE